MSIRGLSGALVALVLVAACDPRRSSAPLDCAWTCACPAGQVGTPACNADGSLASCACAAATCAAGTSLAVGPAAVLAGGTAVSFTGAKVQVAATHKQDVDAAEAGCVASLTVRLGEAPGCELALDFGPFAGGGTGLDHVAFTAGSLCPGFPDAVEGVYSRTGPSLQWFGGLDHVADGAAAQACVPAVTLTFASIQPIVLLREGDQRPLVLDLSALSLAGSLQTTGDPSFGLLCPSALQCPAFMHDGGDTWCAPLGDCSPGFHDGGARACVPERSCSPGYGLTPDGACSTWAPTLALVTPRAYASAAALSDGSVLVAGGYAPSSTSEATAAAERLLPDGSGFAGTGSMRTPRSHFTLTLLAGGGALAAGGFGLTDPWMDGVLSSAEEYSEATGEWTATGPLATPRLYHAAVRLADGRVMVVGGEDATFTALASTELYDPAARTWSPGPDLPVAMWRPGLVALPGGRILAITYGAGAVYDPVAGAWTGIGAPYFYGYGTPSLALLPDGRVLVVASGTDARIYDPASDGWQYAGALPVTWAYPTAVAVPGGRVLQVGGGEAVYDPVANAWAPVPAPLGGRDGHVAVALPDGRVLVAGGYEPFNATADVFLGRW